jgi:hypothetical protein
MWETVRRFLGSATSDEIALAAIFFLCIVGFSWAPRVGEALGSLFDAPEDEP